MKTENRERRKRNDKSSSTILGTFEIFVVNTTISTSVTITVTGLIVKPFFAENAFGLTLLNKLFFEIFLNKIVKKTLWESSTNY